MGETLARGTGACGVWVCVVQGVRDTGARACAPDAVPHVGAPCFARASDADYYVRTCVRMGIRAYAITRNRCGSLLSNFLLFLRLLWILGPLMRRRAPPSRVPLA